MNNILSLLKVNFLSYINFGTKKGKKKKQNPKKKLIGFLALVVVITALVYVYAMTFAEALSLMGSVWQLTPLLISYVALIDFFISFYATSNVLYNAKDYDMLTAMPIKNSEIIISRFAFMYLSSFAISLVVTAIGVILSAQYGFIVTAGFVARMLVISITAPLMPLCIAIIFGVISTYISSFFKRKSIVQLVFYSLVFVGIFYLSFMSSFESEAEILSSLNVLGKVYFLFPWVNGSVTSWKDCLLFTVVSIVAFSLVVTLVSLTFKKINSLFKTRRVSKKFKVTRYRGRTEFTALYRKETSRLFSSAVYASNVLIGAVMSIILLVVGVVVIKQIEVEVGKIPLEEILKYLPAIFTFTSFMSPTTIATISLEGKSYFLVKTLPINKRTLLNAKLAIHLTYFSIPAFVTSLVACIILGANALLIAMSVVSAVGITVLSGIIGLLCNLLLPKMKWETEAQVIKQSGATFVSIVVAFLLTAIFGVGAYYLPFNSVVSYGIITALVVILSVLFYAILMDKGEKLLDRIAI